MSGFWKVQGRDLGDEVTTRIIETGHSTATSIENRSLKVYRESERIDRVGTPLPRLTIEFSMIGRGVDKFDELDLILNDIERDGVWTLQAPDDPAIMAWRNKKRVAVKTIDHNFAVVSSAKAILRVEVAILGTWIVDGGTFCEEVSGYFENTGGTHTVFNIVGIEDQDGEVKGATALLRLPEQTAGYPKAIRASDGALVEVSGPESIDHDLHPSGFLVTNENYNMTGFLHASDPASGEVATFEVCSSPTVDWLTGGSIVGGQGGIAGIATATFATGAPTP